MDKRTSKLITDSHEDHLDQEDETPSSVSNIKKEVNLLPEMAFSVKNGSFAWPKSTTNVLQNINVEIKTGSLTVVIGPSGSGKAPSYLL